MELDFKSDKLKPEPDHLAAKSKTALKQRGDIIFPVQHLASKDVSSIRHEPFVVLFMNADIFRCICLWYLNKADFGLYDIEFLAVIKAAYCKCFGSFTPAGNMRFATNFSRSVCGCHV